MAIKLMYKDSLKIVLLNIFILLALTSHAQLYQYGIHAGYSFSKFKVKDNQPTDDIRAINGRTKGGPTFGIQFLYGPPKDQTINKFHIISSVFVETSVCLCGGRILMSTSLTDTSRTIRELDFSSLRVDFSPKFMARMKQINFIIGPTISKMFQAELDLTGTDAVLDANGFFNPVIIGYEAGIGYELKTINFSARYQSHLTGFGKESAILPTDFKNHQFRFMIHYYFLQKHRGSYLDTIYW